MRPLLVGWMLCLAVDARGTDDPFPGPTPDPYSDHFRVMYYLDAVGNEQPVCTADDWALRRSHILEGMQRAMGPLPDRDPLHPVTMKVVDETEFEGYRRLTIRLPSGDGDEIPADLYLPTQGETYPLPAMLALHPTGARGKRIIAGHPEHPNRQYAQELAEQGYVVIAPDYPSFGDYPYDFVADQYASGTMKGIVNHMRCVDLLVSLPEVDPQRIGVIGHSLGGHNAIFVGVFDERLRAVVSSCGWTPFHDYYEGNIAGWTSDRYMPRLKTIYDLDPDRVPFDFPELIACLAPRGFFTSSPLHDGNFEVQGVQRAMPMVKEVYDLLGASSRLKAVYPECDHDFPAEVREEAYRFLRELLQEQ